MQEAGVKRAAGIKQLESTLKSALRERDSLSSRGLAPAVLSATGGLTTEFGTGSGDPPLHGPARAGRSAREPSRALPPRPALRALAAAQRFGDD